LDSLHNGLGLYPCTRSFL